MLKVTVGIGLITITAMVLSTFLAFNYSEKLLLEAASEDVVKVLRNHEETINTIINDVSKDAQMISGGAAVQKLIQQKRQSDPLVDQEDWKGHLENAFTGLINRKGYQQIRFIGLEDNGRELVRVDGPVHPGESPRIISEGDLQQKGHRDYVVEGAKLLPGQTFVSSVTLNREHGKIQVPWNPTQRFVAPVYLNQSEEKTAENPEPELVGMVVINTNTDRLMHLMDSGKQHRNMILVNTQGGILYHWEKAKCWQFEFEPDAGLAKSDPHVWQHLFKTSGTIDWDDPTGRVNVATRIALGHQKDKFLGLIISTTPEELLATSKMLKKRIAITGIFSLLVALILGALLVKNLIKPIVLLTGQADELVAGQRTAINVSHGLDEVGHLGRTFERLINSLEDKVSARTQELVVTQNQLERDARIFDAMNKALGLSLYSTSPEELLAGGLDLLLDLNFLAIENKGAAFLVEEDSKTLVMTAHRNLAKPLQKTCERVPFGHCLCGRAAEAQEIIFEKSTNSMHDVSFEGMPPHGHYTVPLLDGPNVLGVMVLYVPHDAEQNQDDMEFLTGFSDILAGAIRRLNTEKELKKARQEAISANQSKSAFLANMSHEIRTPMTAILGYTDLLAEDNLCLEERMDHVATIKQNGSHLLTIINDILDISKIEAGKMELEIIPISLWDIVSDVQSLLEVRAQDQGTALQTKFEYPLPETVNCDPVRLRQVILNLVGNSIKFTKDGEVTITTSLINEKIRITVSDTGIGMSPKQVRRLFKPFSQADSSTTRKFGGTGLGLTISKRLTEMMGGSISLESEEGKGSKFTIEIDPGDLSNVAMLLEKPQKSRATSPVSASENSGTFTSARLLLAEDTLVNQKLAIRLLSKAGHTVDAASNGKQALEMALEQWRNGTPYEVILMDMQMPVMDGYEATTELRNAGYNLPVIALTANAMASDREKCIAAGCDDFATKPFQKMKLLNTIETWRSRSLQPV